MISKLALYFGNIKLIWADGRDTGRKPIDWAHTFFNIVWTEVKRPRRVFKIVKFRWIVERTFGWMNYQRRLSKDYEFYPKSSETFVKFASIGMMVWRITQDKTNGRFLCDKSGCFNEIDESPGTVARRI